MKKIFFLYLILLATQVITSFGSQSLPLDPVGCMIAESLKSADASAEPPILISLADAEYPKELAEKYVTGEVQLKFIIGVDSRASQIEVVNRARPEFFESAKHALEKARFKPALKDGKPVAVAGSVTFLFSFRSDLR
jgi:outer membrane biosynthesis protein TonB